MITISKILLITNVLMYIIIPDSYSILFNNAYSASENINYDGENHNSENLSYKPTTSVISYILSIIRETSGNFYKLINDLNLFEFVREQYPIPSGRTESMIEYDFIVVGAGSAGSVVASRLSEEGKWSVLLLEAGKTESLITDIPALTGFLLNTEYNWGYTLEPQNSICQAILEQRCPLLRGKALGGSSVINFMLYTRGNRKDWDQLAKYGNVGWSYDEVFPYFLKSEAANLDGLNESPNHNRNGLLSVEYAYMSPLTKLFLNAGKELGYNITDYNSEDQIGFSKIQSTTRRGSRHSVSRAFLSPFKNRPNLHIRTQARVTKINIDRITKTAKSVEFVRNKIIHRVRARKEIILSAGTLITPQLLMLSGVGPKGHLEEMGIDLIQDLNVGENLHDHLILGNLGFLINQTGLTLSQKYFGIKELTDWLKNGNGLFASPIGAEGISYVKTKFSEDKYADLEIIFGIASYFSDTSGALTEGIRVNKTFFNEIYGDIVGEDGISLTPMNLYSKSRGYIRLKDKNPFHWPKVFYDVHPHDIRTIVEGVKIIMQLVKTKSFSKLGAVLGGNPLSYCNTYEFGTDDYWYCAVKYTILPGQHHMGTCKMGPSTDPTTVVDNYLRVHGIKRLRVADLSIVPKPISPHTNAVAIMIGERAADFIKKY